MRKLGIYVHIPFCVKKCRYCDFLSFPAPEERKQEYVCALLKEIEREAIHYKEFTVDSLFIGGGTPSTLPEGTLEEILDSLRRFYRFTEEPEITVEINPGTVDRKKLESYHRAGVNRVSIGAQSVHGKELAYLGRIHSAGDFFRSYRDAGEAGFTNINVDIMAALPGQSIEDHMDNLAQIVSLKPAHISAYSLMIEEGTPFYELYGEEGKESKTVLPLPSEEEEREMDARTEAFLKEKGYHRYEISNYALSGRECRHNTGYWKRKDYAGFGLGASSMVDNVRWKNLSSMDDYVRRILKEHESVREEISRLGIQEQMEEFMFLGLRLTEGVGRKEFRKTFGKDVEDVYGAVMEKLSGQGVLETGETIRLTPYGRDVSNYVMAEFLI